MAAKNKKLKTKFEDIEMNDIMIDGEYDDMETLDSIMFEDFKKNLEENFDDLEDIKEETSKFYIEQAVYDYLNGQEEAFDYIYNHYRPVLERLGRRRNDDELAQELSVVLFHAVQKFDILAGVKFNTFFWTCAQNHIGTQNIRKNAQKRSGTKKVEKVVYNPETGKEEVVTEVVKTKVVSLQSTLKNKDSETEIANFIENDKAKADYKETNLRLSLQQIADQGLINEKEMLAIKMICEGATLAEIGEKLGNITAPAVHVMLRRLGKKKIVGNYLREILVGS